MADVRVTPQRWLWRPRTKPIRFIEVHATRGSTTPALQKLASLNWVMSARNVGNVKADGTPDYANPEWGSSFSHVIGTLGDMGSVLDDDQMPTYSSGYGGPGSTYAIDEYGISYELAQSAAQEPFADACLRRAAREIAGKCVEHGIPPVFVEIPQQSGPVPTGLVRHDRCQNGYVLGKTDPGDQFNETAFLALVRAEMQVPPEEGETMTNEQLTAILTGIQGGINHTEAASLVARQVTVEQAANVMNYVEAASLAARASASESDRREADRVIAAMREQLARLMVSGGGLTFEQTVGAVEQGVGNVQREAWGTG